jgi:hypothetical protein
LVAVFNRAIVLKPAVTLVAHRALPSPHPARRYQKNTAIPDHRRHCSSPCTIIVEFGGGRKPRNARNPAWA